MRVEIFILILYAIEDEPEVLPKATPFGPGGEGMGNNGHFEV